MRYVVDKIKGGGVRVTDSAGVWVKVVDGIWW